MIRRVTLLCALLAACPLQAADSYNEIFGIGAHSGGPVLWHNMQDDAANTTVSSQSAAGAATLAGGATTADQSVAGPNAWLPKAINLQSSPDSITLSGSALGSNDATLLMFCKHNSTASQGWGIHGEPVNSGTASHYPFDSTIYCSTWRSTGGADANRINVGALPAGTTSWHQIAVKTTPGADGWSFRINGTDRATATGHASLYTGSGTWRVGRGTASPTGEYLNAAVAGFAVFNTHLSDAEEANAFLGPELNYVSGATLGSDGAYNIGTWALPAPFASVSNGSPTYIVSAVNAAGDVIGSDTTSSGSIDISEENGNTVYLVVRASNSGGYDIGDKATRTSSFGSSGDGYYEIASVTAGGGGGGPTVPVLMHHYKGLR